MCQGLGKLWRWFVALATAVIFAVTYGFLYSFGLLMVELIEEFGSDVITTGYVGTAAWGATCILCLFTTPLAKKIGCRLASILGVVTCATSAALSSFVPSVVALFGAYSLLYAIGNALVTTAVILIVLEYFPTRHTTTAMAIASAGVNAGVLLFNPLMHTLITAWGWRVALRISSAVLLGIGLPCCLTMSPPRSQGMQGQHGGAGNLADDIWQGQSTPLDSMKDAEKDAVVEALAQRDQDVADGVGDELAHSYLGDTRVSSTTCSTRPDTQSYNKLDIDEPDGVETISSHPKGRSQTYLRTWGRIFRYPDVWSLALGYALSGLALTFLYFSTVNFIVTAGFSKQTASIMMSVMGASELVGKLVMGFGADRIPVPKICLLMVANVVGAIVLYSTFYAATEAAIFAIVSVEGFVVMAAIDSLPHTIGCQSYAPDLSSHIWALTMVALGAGGIMGAIFGGSVDRSGSYDSAIYAVVGVILVSIVFLGLVPVYQVVFARHRFVMFANARARNRKARRTVPAKKSTDEKKDTQHDFVTMR